MLSGFRKRLDRIGDRCRAGRQCKRAASVFQGGNPRFKHAFRRICQPAVDISRILQGEAVGRMLGVMEYIGSGCVDRNRPCVCCGVGLFLADVKLLGFNTPVFRISDICHFMFPLFPYRSSSSSTSAHSADTEKHGRELFFCGLFQVLHIALLLMVLLSYMHKKSANTRSLCSDIGCSYN